MHGPTLYLIVGMVSKGRAVPPTAPHHGKGGVAERETQHAAGFLDELLELPLAEVDIGPLDGTFPAPPGAGPTSLSLLTKSLRHRYIA